jgi:hypothetical protein
MHYGGNLTPAAGLFADSPVNTDDRPFIEYSAPLSHARTKAGLEQRFRGESLAGFYDLMLRITPPGEDPYLKDAGDAAPLLVRAGNRLHSHRIYTQLRNRHAAGKALHDYNRLVAETRSLNRDNQE